MRSSLFDFLRRPFIRQPLFKQIAIGNSIIIVIGAIGGTLLTRLLTDQAADISLIALFATIGTLLSITLNYWLIKLALRPLIDLSNAVEKIHTGETYIPPEFLQAAAPDISQIAAGLNTLVIELEAQNRQLRHLSERAINAHEEERKRIARSLHDDTGQALSMLIINLEHLENQLTPEDSGIREKLTNTRNIAQVTLSDLRKTIHDLRPTILDDLGLVPAIRWYARNSLEEAGIRVDFNATDEFAQLSQEIKTTLFRIAQEAVTNIVRHSNAGSAKISLERGDDIIRLHIEDDGHGFNTEQISSCAVRLQQWGLVGIIERAELVGGNVRLDSKPGRGTSLEVTMPVINGEVA